MLFKGNFIVFTVFALLELPVSANTLKEGFSNLKRQGSLLLKKRPLLSKYFSTDESTSNKKSTPETEPEDAPTKPGGPTLTNSESNRNLGSVTYFLDPKLFTKDKNGNYSIEETWLPVRELSVARSENSALQSHSSPKGQIEITLLVCEASEDMKSENVENVDGGAMKKSSFKGLKNLMKMGSKSKDEQYLKISTTRMRCSIRAKEGFEKITSTSKKAYQDSNFIFFR